MIHDRKKKQFFFGSFTNWFIRVRFFGKDPAKAQSKSSKDQVALSWNVYHEMFFGAQSFYGIIFQTKLKKLQSNIKDTRPIIITTKPPQSPKTGGAVFGNPSKIAWGIISWPRNPWWKLDRLKPTKNTSTPKYRPPKWGRKSCARPQSEEKTRDISSQGFLKPRGLRAAQWPWFGGHVEGPTVAGPSNIKHSKLSIWCFRILESSIHLFFSE